MAVRRRVVNGEPTWVIDRRFRTENGLVRYRRAAQVQTRSGAEAEERRLQNYFAEHGTIAPFLETSARRPPKKIEPKVYRWEDAVDYYKKNVLPLHEASTRKSYRVLLGGVHMRHWNGTALGNITRASIVEWDARVKQSGVSPSTRRNHHCVLRSVLRAVGPYEGEAGLYLETLPNFPALPKVGRTEVGAVPEGDIRVLLGERPKAFHFKTWTLFGLAVALSAFAGLRSSEIRALRRRDVDLAAGVITVRLKRCVDEEGPPKSQHQRAIDFIAPELLPRLQQRCRNLKPDDYVCPNSTGRPWADSGLWSMFRRACRKLGIEGQRLHGLRHAFVTALFAGGVDARTVQELAGHGSLGVTERYAHPSRERKRAAGRVFEDFRVLAAVEPEGDESEP